MTAAPVERDHLGLLPVVVCEGISGGCDGKPEHAKGHAPFGVTFKQMDNFVLDDNFRHFSNKELSTHTPPPSLTASQAPAERVAYLNMGEQGPTGIIVPVRFSLTAPESRAA